MAMENELEREVELSQFSLEKMFRTFAFFAGYPVESIKEYKGINDVANIYYACLAVLFEEEDKMELQKEFSWNGEKWFLSDPEIKQGSKDKFGAFVDAKQTVQNMLQLGQGKWAAILRLCAIYLRKEGEEYKEEFVYEGSERMELMKKLPMDIAMQVGFFLTSIQNFYLNTSTFSKKAESKGKGRISKRTSKDMAG